MLGFGIKKNTGLLEFTVSPKFPGNLEDLDTFVFRSPY